MGANNPIRKAPIPTSFAEMRAFRAASFSSSRGGEEGSSSVDFSFFSSLSSAGGGGGRDGRLVGIPNLKPPSFAILSAMVRRFDTSASSASASSLAPDVSAAFDSNPEVSLFGTFSANDDIDDRAGL